MRKEWNGLLVGKDEYEEKHPQLEPFGKVADPEAIKNARPETNLEHQRSFQYGFNPVGFKPTLGAKNDLVANGQVGTVGIAAKVNITGNVITGNTGTVVVSIPITFSVSGSSSTGSVGTVTVVV